MTPLQTSLFAAMIFGVVVLLSMALILPTVGTGAQANRKMRKKINWLLNTRPLDSPSLMRESGAVQSAQTDGSSLNHPLVNALELTITQAGVNTTVERLVVKSLLLGVGGIIALYTLLNSALIAALAGSLLAFLPYMRLRMKRQKRLDRFEEQLAEALDIMSRALKAGHPFNETLNFVAEEMDDPIGPEFARLFSDINYGMPSKTAFYALMQRIPSVSLHTLITAVLIQQESGGALAEILEKVAEVIRGRFRLQRKLKTLSAEGRMSAWVLSVLPFVLAGMLMIIAPDYLPVLIYEPAGQKLIMTAFGLLIVGIFWMRSIIRIKV